MKPKPIRMLAIALMATSLQAAEYHVATSGADANPGTKDSPLRHIQRAADLAQPGDVITVHAGVYRERVDPPRGGTSDSRRIVYQAAPGETVEIRGSEVVRGWEKVREDLWKVTLPDSFFNGFNPYNDLIHGDWFTPKNRRHHTGAVYLNGGWLAEAATPEDVMKPAGNTALWFGQVENGKTTILAQFRETDPNEQLVEINTRRTVFHPEKTGIDFLTVRGFAMRHAATPWAPPTAGQIGLIGTNWSKGWIIENNIISHSACSGIALGKYGDEWDNKSQDTAEGYVKTIERALANGWNKDSIGHHIVRNNTISHCEQTGIVGSLGAVFSTIHDNTIHDIHVRQLFTGAEMAGIKLHAAIDVTIRNNHIHHTCRGIWLDWMAQGARVSQNLLHDNGSEDLFMEVDHGPYLVDNNLFLSRVSLLDVSQGGAFAHNLFAGRIHSAPEPNRSTPYHTAHDVALAGFSNIKGGDNRFYNNLFVGDGKTQPPPGNAAARSGFGLWVYDTREFPLQTGGNVYCNGAKPCSGESEHLELTEFNPGVKLVESDGKRMLQLAPFPDLSRARTRIVNTALLGKTRVSGLPYQNPDGSDLEVDTDFSGKKRNAKSPSCGPFDFEGGPPVLIRLR